MISQNHNFYAKLLGLQPNNLSVIMSSDMVQVTRKDEKEANENGPIKIEIKTDIGSGKDEK